MAWLLDTNAWIQILKRPGGTLGEAVVSHPPDEILLCSVVKGELWQAPRSTEEGPTFGCAGKAVRVFRIPPSAELLIVLRDRIHD